MLKKIGFLSVCALFFFSATYAQQYTIKFSHVVSPSTPKGKAANYFAKLVNERMAGKVKVEVYPNSQLYDDNKVLEAMRLSGSKTQGIMAAPSLSKFVKFSKTIQLFDLPFLFKDLDDVHTLLKSPLAGKIFKSLEKRGMTGLTAWDNGMKVFSIRGNNALINVPRDFKGKKFRIQTSNVHEAMIKAFGGIPQKLPFKEVYTSLSKGVVDGQENAWSNVYSKKFFEVQDYITVSNHSYLGYLVVVSQKFWNNLPSNIRKELKSILEEATRENWRIASVASDADRKKIEAAGYAKVIDLSDADKASWRKAALQIEKKFEKQIGKDLIKQTKALLK